MQNALAPDTAPGTAALPAATAPSEILTKEQLADLLQVSRRTIENLQQKGLPYIALGPRRNRYLRAEVMAWMRDEYQVRRMGAGGRP